MSEDKERDVITLRASYKLIPILEKIRIAISRSTSESFSKQMSYYQLTDILAEKLEKGKWIFTFP